MNIDIVIIVEGGLNYKAWDYLPLEKKGSYNIHGI